ncbi:MAG: condensation domain-containing protein, partial [Mucilaginibacter sp.]
MSDQRTYDTEIVYWKNKLQGVSPLLLNTDFNRTSATKNGHSSIEFALGDNIAGQLSQLSKEQEASSFDILLAGLNILLFRYSNQEDICIGNAVPEDKENLLALRNEITGEDIFTDLLKRVKNTTLEAHQNKGVSFEKVIEGLGKDTKNGNPFFKIVFAFNVKNAGNEASKHELSFMLNESPTGVSGEISYDTALYKESTIERMAGHYGQLLDSIVKNPSNKTGALPMLTPAEEQDILVKFNDTLTYYPV